MASLGNIINAGDTITNIVAGVKHYGSAVHYDETKSFALSWPYLFNFVPQTGKATVNVTGGHIGTLNVDGGDVYGSARGEAGDRYEMAHFAYANETEVNIDYKEPYEVPEGQDMVTNIENNYDTQCITGSVHGSGENGYVYGDTHVTLNKGLIGHSLYGAGKGKGTYTKSLNKIGGGGTYDAKIYSLIAGKVFGNTYVTMNDGHVGRNVYGGGNMGSVGKGNYAGGNDDYVHDSEIGAAQGYGEKIDAALWTPTAGFKPKEPITESNKPTTMADYFLSSGNTTVNVISGTVGYVDAEDPANSIKNELPYGNVFGGSAGEAAANIAKNPRYEYSPAFFSGYVNETDVTIGGYTCNTAYGTYKVGDMITADDFKKVASADQEKWTLVGPTILASVYGGGQDGHVRRDTKVTVYAGEIGMPFTEANKTKLHTTSSNISEVLDNPQWMHRGNVYGGGSGITKYAFDLDGDGKTDKNDGSLTYNDKPFYEEDYSNSSGSVTRFTEVNILGGTIHRNVYGGCSMGSVGPPNMGQSYEPYSPDDTGHSSDIGRQSLCTVNIKGTIGSPTGYKEEYGGEVYGASRGLPALIGKEEDFSYVIWTKVNVFDGSWIKGNVFGGGDSGAVKRDTEVVIGATPTP